MKIIFDGAVIAVEPYSGKQGRRYHRHRIWCDGKAVWLSPARYGQCKRLAEYALEHDATEFGLEDADVSIAVGKNLLAAIRDAGRMWYRPFAQIATNPDYYTRWRWEIPLSSFEISEDNLGRLIQGFISIPRPERYERTQPLKRVIEKRGLNVHDLQHAPANRFANYITGIMAGETEYQRTRT